jgi:hypothetical protein
MHKFINLFSAVFSHYFLENYTSLMVIELISIKDLNFDQTCHFDIIYEIRNFKIMWKVIKC